MNPGNFYQGHTLLSLPYEISTKNINENCLYVSDQLLLSDRLSLRMGLRLTAWNSIGPATEYGYEAGALQVNAHAYGELYSTYVTGDPRFGLVYELESGDLSMEDFEDLMRGEQDLMNMTLLTEKGLSAARIERFRKAVVDCVVNAAKSVI